MENFTFRHITRYIIHNPKWSEYFPNKSIELFLDPRAVYKSDVNKCVLAWSILFRSKR